MVDTDKDRLGLERLLFIQFMRVLTRWGLSFTREGFCVSPKVQTWGRESPALLCAALKKKYGDVIHELALVFNSFSDEHQSYLKKLYHLPDLPWV